MAVFPHNQRENPIFSCGSNLLETGLVRAEGGSVNLPPDAQKAIEKAADRGNDVEIRKKGGGYIILEVSKKIIYRSSDR